MSKYQIKPYSFQQAKKIGVKLELSKNPKYKIDVYLPNGDYLTSIGAKGYSDYPHYIESDGQEYADKRRALYHQRHKKDIQEIGSRGWFAGHILW